MIYISNFNENTMNREALQLSRSSIRYASKNIYKHLSRYYITPSECSMRMSIHGECSVNLTHPVDADGRWKMIVPWALIEVRDMLFIITKVKKTHGNVEAEAEFYPLYLSKKITCYCNGRALRDEYYAQNNNYRGLWKDYCYRANVIYDTSNMKPTDVISGRPTVYEQILYGNKSMKERYGLNISYGYNKIDITEPVKEELNAEHKTITINNSCSAFDFEIDYSGVYNHIDLVPYNTYDNETAYLTENSWTLDNPNPINGTASLNNVNNTLHLESDIIIASSKASKNDTDRGMYSYDYTDSIQKIEAEKIAIEEMERYAELNGVFQPNISLRIDVVELNKSTGEENFDFQLGEIIRCVYDDYDIDVTQVVEEIEYDCITDTISSVVIGKGILREIAINVPASLSTENKENKNSIEKIKHESWEDVSLIVGGGFSNYSSATKLKVKKTGNIVNIAGILVTNDKYTGTAYDGVTFGTLPSGYSPKYTKRFKIAPQGVRSARLTVGSSGALAIDYIRDSNGAGYTHSGSGIWINIDVTYER